LQKNFRQRQAPFFAAFAIIKLQKLWSETARPGVDVMIAIFCDFRQFSAKKLAFFQKPML
jgi:hypothetical protein